MTNEQVENAISSLWATPKYRKIVNRIGPEECKRQRLGLIGLCRREMDDLKKIGLDEETAWTEARRICLVSPVVPDPQ